MCTHTQSHRIIERLLISWHIWLLLLPYLMWLYVPSLSPHISGSIVSYVSAEINSMPISEGFGVLLEKKKSLFVGSDEGHDCSQALGLNALFKWSSRDELSRSRDLIHPSGLQHESYAPLHHLPASLIWASSHRTIYPEGRRHHSQLRSLSPSFSFLVIHFLFFFSS